MNLKELKSKIEGEIQKSESEISIIDLVQDLITYCYKSRASDIHIDPEADKILIKARIDGIIYNLFTFPKGIQDEIISRIKILAGLRTDEHYAPQDGRFKFRDLEAEKEFDVRVSIMPTYFGENAVLRLLVSKETSFTLETLGLSERDLKEIKKAIKKPYGMILVTGPTGSGKTTTLYTILKTLNTGMVSIITLEDPIEYSISGITQIQVNPQVGLEFSTGLRAILRQDPDIIMVGEIRDEETANIAVNAALTGHLLLSTLHTNDAATALPRLLEMGVEPFLIASTVNVVIAQRLVRKICENCKEEKKFSTAEILSFLESIGLDLTIENIKIAKKSKFYYGKGCEACNNSGYYGRIGIFEVLSVTDKIREAIMKRLNSSEIKSIAINEGMTTMVQDGFNKVLQGLTTIEEILRVIHE